MATDTIERVNYFPGQYLGSADLNAQAAYDREMRRRHNIAQHTWGVVSGLQLVARVPAGGAAGGPVDVFILPGMAVDGYGRELFVFVPTQLDPALFHRLGSAPNVPVYIAYDQNQSQPPTAGNQQCADDGQFARTQETVRIFGGLPAPLHDATMVAGSSVQPPKAGQTPDPSAISIPPDESVGYQELPDDSVDPHWYVYLGTVNWKQGQGASADQFLGADSDPAGRRYAGLVGADLSTAGPLLRVHRRADPAAADLTDFLTRLEGNLRVTEQVNAEADVVLEGGKLRFQLQGGDASNTPPLFMTRNVNNLNVHVGPAGTPLTQLAIGFGDPDNQTDVLRVKNDNTVQMPTSSLNVDSGSITVSAGDITIPAGAIRFGTQTRQMLDLWKEDYAIGVQWSTLYNRSGDGNFIWYRGGKHNDDPAAGGNGTVEMKLDSTGALSIAGNLIVGGNRSFLVGQDGSGLHWVMAGASQAGAVQALGFDAANQAIDVDQGWHLAFGAQTRQMVDLWGTQYGIGVQGWTLYSRTDADFCWFRGGGHSNVRSDPGGGTLAMKLDDTSSLNVYGDLFVRGAKVPIDVVQFLLTFTQASGTGSQTVTVVSRLAQVSSASAFAVLKDFECLHQNTTSQWQLSVSSMTKNGANAYDVTFQYNVTMGYLNAVTLVVVFVP